MNKPFAFLFLAATLLFPTRARALPTQATYRALFDGAAAGTLRFAFDAQVPGACQYVMAWDFGGGVPGEQCVLDEATWIGHRSCFANALEPVQSFLTLAPDWDCWGFDSSGQDSQVYLMVLGESPTNGALAGLVQLDSASSPLHGFSAAPSP